jgi:hypothetical protein
MLSATARASNLEKKLQPAWLLVSIDTNKCGMRLDGGTANHIDCIELIETG